MKIGLALSCLDCGFTSSNTSNVDIISQPDLPAVTNSLIDGMQCPLCESTNSAALAINYDEVNRQLNAPNGE